MKRIYANWRLKCGENRRLKLTVVGETGPESCRRGYDRDNQHTVDDILMWLSLLSFKKITLNISFRDVEIWCWKSAAYLDSISSLPADDFWSCYTSGLSHTAIIFVVWLVCLTGIYCMTGWGSLLLTEIASDTPGRRVSCQVLMCAAH